MTRVMRGYTFIEVVFALGVAATATAVAVPNVRAGLDNISAFAAARYIAARLQYTRLDAVRRNTNTAMRFTLVGGAIRYAEYADGNANGVRTADIHSGVDGVVGAIERLEDQFPRVTFGALPGLPAVDPSGAPPAGDPIRFGSSSMAVFTPSGTATPGSVYIKGRGGSQYVVRVFGDTGKTRVLKFNPATRTWQPI